MRVIIGKKVHMADCLPGDIVALTPTMDVAADNHFNIVVKPSLLLVNKSLSDENAFNVISLNNGRPRSFHKEVDVYLFDRNEVFQ